MFLSFSCSINYYTEALSSVDTLTRVIKHVSQDRRSPGISILLFPGARTVASIDNVDELQLHASVMLVTSWHATNIQLVQPQPMKNSGDRVKRRLFASC